jgi:hypothetical protein
LACASALSVTRSKNRSLANGATIGFGGGTTGSDTMVDGVSEVGVGETSADSVRMCAGHCDELVAGSRRIIDAMSDRGTRHAI